MQYHPSSRIPTSNMSAYISSTPKAPLDPGTAAFVNPPPAIVQPAEMTCEQFKAEARAAVKHMESATIRTAELAEMLFTKRWREFGPTRDLACSEVFGCSRSALRHKINYWNGKLKEAENSSLAEDEDKKNTLSKIASLPIEVNFTDPMADLNPPEPPKAKGNGHMTGKAVKDTLLENGESTEDYKRHHKAPTHSGKPIYAMPAWKELEEFIGKAINRADAVNRLMPNPKAHRGLLASLKDAFTRAQSWHEEAKHA